MFSILATSTPQVATGNVGLEGPNAAMKSCNNLALHCYKSYNHLVGAPRMARVRSYGDANLGTAMAVILLCCIVQCSHAKSVDVGGTAGWTSFDSSRSTTPNYVAWASSQKFLVGDSLVFRFAAGVHNVWQMKSQAAYQSCDFSGATLLDAGDSGFFTWRATYSGEYYFSCDKGAEGVGTHCNYNQKLAILVSKVATPPWLSPLKAPSPSPLPSTITPSPSSLPLPPSPHSLPAPTPIAHSPVHAPAPAHAPWTASGPASIPSLSPTKPPFLAPSSSPVRAPSSSPVLTPTPVPASAPASVISPVSSPSMSPPSSGPIASTPSAWTPESSSPPMPDLPEVPGGGPASASPSEPNAGVLSVQLWSPLVYSLSALLCFLLW